MKKLKEMICICILMFSMTILLSGCSTKAKEGHSVADESYEKMEETMEKYHEIQSTIHSDSEIGPGTITFTDDNYLSRMEEILLSIDKYIGREICYSGTISVVHGASDDVFVLGRYFNQVHDDHEHEGVVGIAFVSDDETIAEGEEFEVSGQLDVAELNGVMVPVIRASELKRLK